MSGYELLESKQSVKAQHYNELLARLNGVLENRFFSAIDSHFFYFFRCKYKAKMFMEIGFHPYATYTVFLK